MKYTFNYFKKLLFESILNEDKSRLIDRLVLPDIDGEEEKQKARDEINSFFKRYSNYENKLDWNKLDSITYADFEKVKELANKSKGARKREIATDIKSIFKSIGNKKFEIMGENEGWLFVAPLSWEAAVYCDSSENQGAGAKWCIGYEKDDQYWAQYTDGGSLFIMAFNKNYKSLNQEELQTNLKYMIEKTPEGRLKIWNQEDSEGNYYHNIFTNKKYLNEMFSKVKIIFNNIRKEEKQNAKQSVIEKIENLKNISKIPANYFNQSEKELLTTIEIPDNIKIIGENAFQRWSNLTNVIIPNGVIKIENKAFYDCENLRNITIPDSVKSIGKDAFSACINLTTANIPDGVPYIGCFPGCIRLKHVKIGNGVTDITDWAFFRCLSLQNVSIPDSVTNIGVRAFMYCENLRNITIPDSVTNIDYVAFDGCKNLKNIVIGNSVKSIGKAAFSECTSLTNIIIPDSVTNLGESVFEWCTNLQSVTIGRGITNINKNIFDGCKNLKEIIFIGKTEKEIKEIMPNPPEGVKLISR